MVAKITPEPLAVVEQRLQQRLGSPEIRNLLANKLASQLSHFVKLENIRDMNEDEHLLYYKTSIEIASIYLFGKKHQEIDLGIPLELSDKDIELVRQLEPVATSLRLGNKPSALENLKQIPKLAGSEADRGEYDGYNHEALIVTGTSAVMLQNVLNTKPNAIGEKTTRSLSRIMLGFETKDRLKVAKGYTGLL